ncbi:Demethylrebeccamycin-D-glucose O-methyltransferase [Symmachiella macrocystis]|uniref:Demethylrebeccamycin-D-glucose O-methyltransferase n=1 Tax=Symmachiella macrocystis TaxID=2527985 RepID=A0A5C6BS66_9PLAN|nr:class I SAM-dependent methyltransferase [Symmachiella macrocystis]TWU14281.1 Demethylrebeccamycin-D-glucose O-methyltransferase [Symmachiella macrocystis]
MPLQRILEPEVMDSAQEAIDYDTMDHTDVNRVFVDDLLAFAQFENPSVTELRVLDVGTGTAQIPVELSRRQLPIHVTGVDLADEMLKVGRQNVAAAGFTQNIMLERVDAKQLPYATETFDAVISNSIVHHIPDPLQVIVEMARVVRSGGVLFVRDLLRPDDEAELEQLVSTYAADTNDEQRQLFRQSLRAALTVAEVKSLLSTAGLPAQWCVQTTDRHWTLAGRCGV